MFGRHGGRSGRWFLYAPQLLLWRGLIPFACMILLACTTAWLLPARAAPPPQAGTQAAAQTPARSMPANGFCHAVTDTLPTPQQRLALPYSCAGTPEGYESRWLWLRRDLTAEEQAWDAWSFTMRQTRFRQLIVTFHHADGHSRSYAVRAGDFGSQWLPNGNLAFADYRTPAPVTSVTLGFERVASYDMLRLWLVTVAQQQRIAQYSVIVVGASLALLVGSLVFNVFLTVALRQRVTLWHAGWVACMIAWGLFWSQLALAVVPSAAGVASVRICALLAAGALCLATQFVLASITPPYLPGWLRRVLHVLSIAVLPMSAITAFPPVPAAATAIADVYGVVVLSLLLSSLLALALGIWRGSGMARDLSLAWAMPIAAVLYSNASGDSGAPPVISGELMVLAVSALQTIWLSFAMSRRFAALRTERDQAHAERTMLKRLAETDPLTQLYNRRGLTDRIEAALSAARKTGGSVGLMLVDLDHFKSINDTFGHDVGDLVLQHVGRLLGEVQQDGAVVGRLGGEEFCMLIRDCDGPALYAAAERIRRLLAETDMSHVFGHARRRITASFGISDTRHLGATDLKLLLRTADQALYCAKAEGRNRVVAAETMARATAGAAE